MRSNSQEKERTKEENVFGSMLLLEEKAGRPGSIWDMGLQLSPTEKKPAEQG